jgi:hypothetical protein
VSKVLARRQAGCLGNKSAGPVEGTSAAKKRRHFPLHIVLMDLIA